MKIGFVRLDDSPIYEKRSKSVLEPLGIQYLISNLKSQYDIKVWDLNVGDRFEDYDRFDYICITIPTPLYNNAKKLIESIHKNSPAKVIVGGPHPSARPNQSLNDLKADFVVVGEGECILNNILEGNSTEKILGVDKDKTYLEINAINYPDRIHTDKNKYKLDYGDLDKQILAGVITSRSCPYPCTFCASKTIFGNTLRKRTVKNILAELAELLENGYNTIIFLDDTFTFDKERTKYLCEQIIERKLKFIWWVDTRVDKVDRELLEIMSEAGCTFIVYGIESGNEDVLKSIKKRITLDDARGAIKITKEVGIECKANFILGHYGETESQMKDTINFAKELNANRTSFYQMIPLPGTANYDHLKEEVHSDYYDRFKWYGDDIPSICNVTAKRLKEIQQIGYEEMK